MILEAVIGGSGLAIAGAIYAGIRHAAKVHAEALVRAATERKPDHHVHHPPPKLKPGL